MARACGLPDYEGEKINISFKIDFGKKIIHECPMSYCDFTYMEEALESWKYYEDGFLPEVWDDRLGRPNGILDQSQFFVDSHLLVNIAKNKAEIKRQKEQEAQANN